MNFIHQMVEAYTSAEVQALLTVSTKQQIQLINNFIISQQQATTTTTNSTTKQGKAIALLLSPSLSFDTSTLTPDEIYQHCLLKHPYQTLQVIIDVNSSDTANTTGTNNSTVIPNDILHLRTMIKTAISRLAREAAHTNPGMQLSSNTLPYTTCQLAPGNVGCIATRNISVGQVVLEEEPLLSGSMLEMRPDLRSSLLVNKEQMAEMARLDELLSTTMTQQTISSEARAAKLKQIQNRIWNIWIDAKVQQLNEQSKSLFWSLHDAVHDVYEGATVRIINHDNTRLNDKFGLVLRKMEMKDDFWKVKVFGVTCNNAGDDGDKDKDEEEPLEVQGIFASQLKTVGGIFGCNSFATTGQNEECALFSQFSRFNHACQPNLRRRMGIDGKVQAIAVREILLGQELTLCYCKNKEKLREVWKFECCCVVCLNKGFE